MMTTLSYAFITLCILSLVLKYFKYYFEIAFYYLTPN